MLILRLVCLFYIAFMAMLLIPDCSRFKVQSGAQVKAQRYDDCLIGVQIGIDTISKYIPADTKFSRDAIEVAHEMKTQCGEKTQ